MSFDSRWKNPQGKDPEQLWRWAQELIVELRKGEFMFESGDVADLANSQLADMAAWTIKMRNAGTSGEPQDVTINGLTEETSIDRAADFVPFWDAGAGVMRKAKPNNLSWPVHIASGAISAGATEVDIALGTYDMVEIDLMGIEPNTDNVSIFARFSQDNGANFLSGASDYGWGLSNAGTGAGDDADSEITLTGGIGNAAGERAFVTVRIFRPSASSFAKSMSWFGGYRTSAGVHTANHGWGHLLANTDAITHVRFLLESASTIDAGHYAARGYRFS
jgi:hypothetical protein